MGTWIGVTAMAQKILISWQSCCNQWLYSSWSQEGTRGGTSENTFTNRFSKALALRQTGEHCRDVGFCKREESASPQHFNYSHQCMHDFQKRVGAIHIQATQRIKHHADCDRGSSDKRRWTTLWCRGRKSGGWMRQAEGRTQYTKQQSKTENFKMPVDIHRPITK